MVDTPSMSSMDWRNSVVIDPSYENSATASRSTSQMSVSRRRYTDEYTDEMKATKHPSPLSFFNDDEQEVSEPTEGNTSPSMRSNRSQSVRSLMKLITRARDRKPSGAFSPDSSSSFTMSDGCTLMELEQHQSEPTTQDTEERMLDRINRRKDGTTPEIVGNLRGLELEIPDLCRALQTSLDGGLDNDVVTALLEQSGVPPKDMVLQELEDLKLIRCIRSGVMVSIRPSNLVPGDVVCLQRGDIAPADVRIADHSADLKINNSALSPRNTMDDSIILAYSGSFVCTGWLRGIVCATGSATMSARINKEVASPEPLVSKNLRFELYEKYHLLSKDPNPITTVRRNLMDARKAGRMGKFRIPICMDLPADYLRSLKTEAILKHQEMFNAVKSTIQPTLADDITVLICDFANPHYYYRLDQICKIPPSMVLFLPESEVRGFREYFQTVKSATKWMVMKPDEIDKSEIQPTQQNFIIIPDCPPDIKREVVSQLYYIGVLYFGGFDVSEESLLDSCTLSVCLGRSRICIERCNAVCLGSPLQRLIFSEGFLHWLNGKITEDDWEGLDTGWKNCEPTKADKNLPPF